MIISYNSWVDWSKPVPEALLDAVILPQAPHAIAKFLCHFAILERRRQRKQLSSIILNEWFIKPLQHEMLTARSASAKFIFRLPMAFTMAIIDCSVLLYTTALYCWQSSAEYPFSWIILNGDGYFWIAELLCGFSLLQLVAYKTEPFIIYFLNWHNFDLYDVSLSQVQKSMARR